jgi:antitoxin (DNA-binding transcriptional repressor) of toxin-antitoxin stability system
MTQISPQDVAAQLPVILSRVAQGEEFVVTDHGQAVARILPPQVAPATETTDDAWRRQFNDWMDGVDARSERYPKGFTVDDSRESIYHGRGA